MNNPNNVYATVLTDPGTTLTMTAKMRKVPLVARGLNLNPRSADRISQKLPTLPKQDCYWDYTAYQMWQLLAYGQLLLYFFAHCDLV